MKPFPIGLAALVASILAAPAQAAPVSAEERAAARLQELNLMFSSVSMRCKTIGIDLQPGIDKFSTRQKASLSRAFDALKQHFSVRTKADLNGEFDKFHIRVLNFYGTGRTDQQSCEGFGKVMDTLAQADAEGQLFAAVAEVMVPEPMLGAEP